MRTSNPESHPEEARIRRALAAGAFAEAGLLFEAHCQELKSADAAGAKKLLDWMIRTVSAARAHDVVVLKNLYAAATYLRRDSGPRTTVKVDA